ncbi:spermidine synthase [Rhodoferax saidenbachensis]|uniref:Spermidine synthase n=1 Tax=Rhodoferax saidenbachensis TaxID=1484693 RepID=A0A1P8K805_9BURK|nr:spermidine synthase [Rhodoferax saidenbachensis]APW42150.1 spermidine synthase [Rhodoferax saidenbachensis]
MPRKEPIQHPEVNFSEEGPIRHLHLGSEWIQGSMLVDAPTVLVHEYIQRMMAWLLFVDPATVGKRQALQLGLGAGSLTKFCHKELKMKTTAIELNPQVLHACRGWFKLPADNARMQVVLGDAAQEIRQPHWLGAVDALQVDLYDEEAAAPVLDSTDFYADCRNTLTEEGCMTVNLFGRSSSYQKSVDKISAAFGKDALWAFKSTREGNTVVLAQRTPSRPKRALWAERAEVIKAQWGLPADKWIRVFKPVTP